MRAVRHLVLWVVLALFSAPSLASGGDVRLLIDVSGSMLENDPQNLRQPAAALFVEMMPNGSQAGIWTFGAQVNMLVPHREVNNAWRAQARPRIASIGSPGQRTNIGGVLEAATFDLDPIGGGNPSTIILLTDGMVDISQDRAANLRERNRVLQQVLPRLAAGNVRVHTIALSNQADQQLLQFLSYRTNGSYMQVDRVEDLPRVMADLLDVEVPRGQLPLLRPVPASSGSTATASPAATAVATRRQFDFKVDASVSQLLVLAFPEANQSLSLLSPEAELIEQGTRRPDLNWTALGPYQLISLQQPVAGRWQLQGPIAEGNRVSIVSNLNLDVRGQQANYLLGQTLQFNLELVADEPIPAPILADMTYSAYLQHLESDQRLELNVASGRVDQLLLGLPLGSWQLVVRAQSPALERQRSFLVNISEPMTLETQVVQGGYLLMLRALDARIDLQNSHIGAQLNGPSLRLDSALDREAQGFSLFIADPGPGRYQLSLQPNLILDNGQTLLWQPPSLVLNFPLSGQGVAGLQAVATQASPSVAASPSPSPEPTPSPSPSPSALAVAEASEAPASPLPAVLSSGDAAPSQGLSMSYLWYALALVPGLAFLGLMYWLYKRIDAKLSQAHEEEALEADDAVASDNDQLKSLLGSIDLADDGPSDSVPPDFNLDDLPELDEQLADLPAKDKTPDADQLAQQVAEQLELAQSEAPKGDETNDSTGEQISDTDETDLQQSLDDIASDYEQDEDMASLDVADDNLDLDQLDSAWFDAEEPDAEDPEAEKIKPGAGRDNDKK